MPDPSKVSHAISEGPVGSAGPEFRSMAQTLTPSISLTMGQRDEIAGKGVMGSTTTTNIVSMQKQGVRESPLLRVRELQQGTKTTTTTTSASGTSFASWNPRLRPVPLHYPKEETNRILSLSEFPLEGIIESMSECLRVMSVQTHFCSNDTAIALLESLEQVEMRLYLWAMDKGCDICVEIQHCRGDSVAFQRYAKNILDAAGKNFDATEFQDYNDSHHLKAAEDLLKRELVESSSGNDNDNDKGKDSIQAIELAASFLGKDRLDTRRLGFECLCILTDPRKTNMSTALVASHTVLLGKSSLSSNGDNADDEVALKQIHNLLLHLVLKKSMPDEDDMLDAGVGNLDDSERYFAGTNLASYPDAKKSIVNCALTILANAWEIATLKEENSAARSTIVEQFCAACLQLTDTDVTVSLLQDLGQAETNPHDAYYAAKTLRIMCQSSKDIRSRAMKLDAEATTTRAYEVGKSMHARLEAEAHHLLSALHMP